MWHKEFSSLEMKSLNFYHNGKLVHSRNGGVDSFEKNGESFRCDDTVVTGGHIGNIECVSLEGGVVGLGLSYEYDKCMAGPYDWEMYSGYRCRWDDLRHATEEERRKYDKSANSLVMPWRLRTPHTRRKGYGADFAPYSHCVCVVSVRWYNPPPGIFFAITWKISSKVFDY